MLTITITIGTIGYYTLKDGMTWVFRNVFLVSTYFRDILEYLCANIFGYFCSEICGHFQDVSFQGWEHPRGALRLLARSRERLDSLDTMRYARFISSYHMMISYHIYIYDDDSLATMRYARLWSSIIIVVIRIVIIINIFITVSSSS